MPIFEKLDNTGKRTSKKRAFTGAQAQKLLAMGKYAKWVLFESDKPKDPIEKKIDMLKPIDNNVNVTNDEEQDYVLRSKRKKREN